jgi:hypothetical protein
MQDEEEQIGINWWKWITPALAFTGTLAFGSISLFENIKNKIVGNDKVEPTLNINTEEQITIQNQEAYVYQTPMMRNL